MGLIEIILMWIWFAVAFAIISKWPMGKETDRRSKYWARFEGK